MRNAVQSLIIIALLLTGLSACGDQIENISPSSPAPIRTQASAPTLPPPFTPTPPSSSTPTPPATPVLTYGMLADQALAMNSAHIGDVEQFHQATRYSIEVTVEFSSDRAQAQLAGTAQITFVNPSSDQLLEIPLMLWPNAQEYSGQMEIGEVWVDGKRADTTLVLDGIGRLVSLPEPVSPGQSVQLLVPFQVTEIRSFSIMSPRRFGISEGVLFAPTFYPLIPRIIDSEWSLLPWMPNGDSTNSETAFYTVQITAPKDLALITTGVEIHRQSRSGNVHQAIFVSGPTRDFAFALGPLESVETEFEGTLLQVWVLPDHQEYASLVLDAVEKQFALLSELVGAYPYSEFDLVDLPHAFGGIEYPGIVTVGTIGSASYLAPTIHEVGHQWFYGLIGNDQLLEPWMDEGAATYTEVLYHERYSRAGTDTGMLTSFRAQVRLRPDPSMPIGKSVETYPDLWEYITFVYNKGALFFDALRRELGDDLFFEFLHTYFETYRYRFSTSADFQRVAEEVCGCDLGALFELWVEQGGEIPGL